MDDNAGIRSTLKILLPMYFEEVMLLPSPVSLVSTASSFKPDAVLLDMNFKTDVNNGNEGLYWLSDLKGRFPDMAVILFTAYSDIHLAVEGMKRGAYDFIVKPWDNDRLIATLKSACNSARGGKKRSGGNETRMFWGNSPEMEDIRKKLLKIAPTDASVLITGDNGTGKDVLAGEIHRCSQRAGKPLVSVDAGAIPETLFESELFGHVKGAFTNAIADRKGKFEEADGGTLFLDEIGNISLPMQAKLLRAIQNRCITRIGDNKPIPVDLRLVCATNSNLESMVAEGRFREDLYYRINTVHFHIPSLHERTVDIPLLAKIFLDKYSERYHRAVRGISGAALEAMMRYPWNGNIRELQNCIEKAVILSEGEELGEKDLQLPDNRMPGRRGGNETETLKEAEERIIRESMEKYSGNLSLVAKSLDISRPTLYSKLKKYGI